MIEGDIFRVVVPLDEGYSFDYEIGNETGGETDTKTGAITDTKIETNTNANAVAEGKTDTKTNTKTNTKIETNTKTNVIMGKKLTQTEEKILIVMEENPYITLRQLAGQMGISLSGVQYAVKSLKSRKILSRNGSNRKGTWVIHE